MTPPATSDFPLCRQRPVGPKCNPCWVSGLSVLPAPPSGSGLPELPRSREPVPYSESLSTYGNVLPVVSPEKPDRPTSWYVKYLTLLSGVRDGACCSPSDALRSTQWSARRSRSPSPREEGAPSAAQHSSSPRCRRGAAAAALWGAGGAAASVPSLGSWKTLPCPGGLHARQLGKGVCGIFVFPKGQKTWKI